MPARMKEGPPGTRIHWKPPIRQKLATATAETLIARDEMFPPSDRVLSRAFRDVQPIVLEPELRRDFPGLSRVPWLRTMVIDELHRLRAEAEIEHSKTDLPSLPTREHHQITTADDIGLILDALTGIDQKIDHLLTVQEAHEQVLTGLINTVQALGGEVKGLGQIIVKGRERAARKQAEKERLRAEMRQMTTHAPVVTTTASKPVRIAVAGLAHGRQRQEIENRVSGFTNNLTLLFVNDTISPAQVPHFDQLIILERLMGTTWQKKAEHLYPGRIHSARGITTASDLIQRMSQRPENYRAS